MTTLARHPSARRRFALAATLALALGGFGALPRPALAAGLDLGQMTPDQRPPSARRCTII